MTAKFGERLSRLMLRTSATPLRAVWSLAYKSVVRAATAVLRRENREASIYVKGSFASGEPVYGISDIDLVAVIPRRDRGGSAQLAARERWKVLCEKFPLFKLVIQHCWFYEADDLREASSATCFTYGLSKTDSSHDRAAFLGAAPLHDHMGLATNPSLYGIRKEWRWIAGRDNRPASAGNDRQDRTLAAWLHLQYWWRHAYVACAEPHRAHIPLLCIKLIAEPIRLSAWIECGEYIATRRDALRRGLADMEEERETIQLAIDLMTELPRSPDAPVEQAIAYLVRQSERIIEGVEKNADEAGYTDVRLIGADRPQAFRTAAGSCKILPLADWRARVVPGASDETMLAYEGTTVDSRSLAALASVRDANPVVYYNSMMLLPTTNAEHGMLRSVQCEATDPVSFALASGRAFARFPELSGWSASHSARRAVAEHRAWIESPDWSSPPHGWVGPQSSPRENTARTLGLLISAARAALFLESIADGDPRLAVTPAAVRDELIARAGGIVDLSSVPSLFETVRGLPAYSAQPVTVH